MNQTIVLGVIQTLAIVQENNLDFFLQSKPFGYLRLLDHLLALVEGGGE